MDSIDELDMFEAERRLALYNEYRDAATVFEYYIETELRAYLANEVERRAGRRRAAAPYFKVTLTDVWIYEAERLNRFVPEVVIYSVNDVHVQRLKDERVGHGLPTHAGRSARRRRCARRSSITRYRYYVLDSPEISDEAYDALVRELEAIEARVPGARHARVADAARRRAALGAVRAGAPRRAHVLARQRDVDLEELDAWLDAHRGGGRAGASCAFVCELKIDGSRHRAHVRGRRARAGRHARRRHDGRGHHRQRPHGQGRAAAAAPSRTRRPRRARGARRGLHAEGELRAPQRGAGRGRASRRSRTRATRRPARCGRRTRR